VEPLNFGALCEYRLRPLQAVIIVSLPSPPKRNIDDPSRLTYRVKGPECFCQDCPLLSRIEWLPEGMAERPAKEDRPRRFNFFCILSHYGYPDCRDPCSFNLSLYQTNGLIADPSARREKGNINAVCLQLSCNFRRRFAHQGIDMDTQNVSHETIMFLGDPADYALLLKFS